MKPVEVASYIRSVLLKYEEVIYEHLPDQKMKDIFGAETMEVDRQHSVIRQEQRDKILEKS